MLVKVLLITDTQGRIVRNPMPVCMLVKVLLFADTQGRIASNPRTVCKLVKVLLTKGCLSGQPAGPTRGTTYRLEQNNRFQ